MKTLKALHAKKQQEAEGAQAAGPSSAATTASGAASQPKNVFSLRTGPRKAAQNKASAAELRTQKDISEMEPIPGTKLRFPNPDDIMHFEVDIKPTDGLYKGASFVFRGDIGSSYPYEPPKILCQTPVYHPNIDWEGHVCLNILREEWKPVLSIGSVIFGLMTLFLEPNPDDPLNKEAAETMMQKPREFERNVRESLTGGMVGSRKFPKLL